MRPGERPPAGWYPDPEGGVRLRWWDGDDWTDRFRARPAQAELTLARLAADEAGRAEASLRARAARAAAGTAAAAGGLAGASGVDGTRPVDAERLVAEARLAARAEADRAVQAFAREAARTARHMQPLVTASADRALRLLRLLVAAVFVAVAAWVVVRVAVEISLFEWLGERIDRLADPGPGAGAS